jgi:hypothetical protein
MFFDVFRFFELITLLLVARRWCQRFAPQSYSHWAAKFVNNFGNFSSPLSSPESTSTLLRFDAAVSLGKMGLPVTPCSSGPSNDSFNLLRPLLREIRIPGACLGTF